MPDMPKCPKIAVILDFRSFSLLFSLDPFQQRYRLNVYSTAKYIVLLSLTHAIHPFNLGKSDQVIRHTTD